VLQIHLGYVNTPGIGKICVFFNRSTILLAQMPQCLTFVFIFQDAQYRPERAGVVICSVIKNISRLYKSFVALPLLGQNVLLKADVICSLPMHQLTFQLT